MRFLLLFLFTTLILSCNSIKHQNADNNFNPKVQSLLTEMSVEEKVGQMTQITVGVFYKNGKLNKAKLKQFIQHYHLGSILNTGSTALPREEWIELLTLIQDYALENDKKVPVLYGIDAIHGATYTQESILFPHNIGMAATRNPELVKKSAQITAKDVRASGIRWNFDPVLGVGRQPLWPRFEETFGEDVHIVTEMGVAAIKGYEGDDLTKNTNVASCMKHYIGYSVPLSGKDRTPAYIPDIVLRETFLPSFKAAVNAGSSTVMVNSGSINGTPVHINKYLITDVLKNELGFKGLVVTDWFDIIYLHEQHGVAATNREAVKMAINAGIDMSMVPNDTTFYVDLVDLVKSGEVSMERIDDAVGRILQVKYDLGLFDNAYPEKDVIAKVDREYNKKIAKQAALESITLLKNDTIKGKAVLPIPANAKVLITGPAAQSLASLHGSWSFSWQAQRDELYPKDYKTIAEALSDTRGKANCKIVAPKKFKKIDNKLIDQVKREARSVDYIILCLGENSYAETPGNINDLSISADQLQLAKAASSTGKKIILVLTEGRPRIVREIEKLSHGVLLAYRPSALGADAIADVLNGNYNPNGKLAFSYPRYTGNFLTYDAPVRNKPFYNPQWAFGFGLSYTHFKYSNLKLSSDTLYGDENLTITVDVKNTGTMDGLHAVDLFVNDQVASVIPPMRKLKRFTKIELKLGDQKQVKFTINKSDLQFTAPNLKPIVEDGYFKVQLGETTKKFYYKK